MVSTEPIAPPPVDRQLGLKLPQALTESVYAFPPNRNTLGGTAYFIVSSQGNVLVDCPAWHGEYAMFLSDFGGVRWLVLTHRGGMSRDLAKIQSDLGCEIIVQEQEAYLLPTLTVTSFEREIAIADDLIVIWTSGHSPGSSCLYDRRVGGSLWAGRHLLPDREGNPCPLRTAKTFHWGRQLQNVQSLRDRFTVDTLATMYPGASLGFLRGKKAINNAYQRLQAIDLEGLRRSPILM